MTFEKPILGSESVCMMSIIERLVENLEHYDSHSGSNQIILYQPWASEEDL